MKTNEKTETANATNGTLYRVNFTFVDENANIRTQAVVIEAPTEAEAKSIAQYKLDKRGYIAPRITKVKPY